MNILAVYTDHNTEIAEMENEVTERGRTGFTYSYQWFFCKE